MLHAPTRPSAVQHRPTSFHPPSTCGLTLVEVMISLTIAATVSLGFISSFVQSRRITESSVLHAAATSIVYGVIEQIKQLDYVSMLPNYETDPFAPTSKTPPYLRVRLSQSNVVWLTVVHTSSTGTPAAPTSTPAATATASSVGAVNNEIGTLPLSTVSGVSSQQISLNFWVWIDEIPDSSRDVSEVKKITVVYTYSYQDGSRTRTVRDREVFVRTRFDQ